MVRIIPLDNDLYAVSVVLKGKTIEEDVEVQYAGLLPCYCSAADFKKQVEDRLKSDDPVLDLRVWTWTPNPHANIEQLRHASSAPRWIVGQENAPTKHKLAFG